MDIKKSYNLFKDIDKILILLCIVASALSVLLLYSIYYNGMVESIRIVIVQIMASLGGIVIAIIISKLDYKKICKYWYFHIPVSLILVLLTFTSLGIQREGTDDKAWLSVGFTTIQPSEILKLSFIFTFSMHIVAVKEEINKPKNILMLLLHAAIPIGLVFMQGDFGSGLIFVGVCLTILFIAGISWKYIVFGVVVIIVTFPIIWYFVLDEHHRQRIMIIFDPTLDPYNIGYQQLQGRIALGSGMMFGKGLFSKESVINIPEVYNDFIFSYIGQTLGLIGCMIVILLITLVCFRIISISLKSKDLLGRYICVGIFAVILFQSFINIGMVLSIMPVIGVNLPFLSSGGTSVLLTYVAIGVVLNIYSQSKEKMIFS